MEIKRANAYKQKTIAFSEIKPGETFKRAETDTQDVWMVVYTRKYCLRADVARVAAVGLEAGMTDAGGAATRLSDGLLGWFDYNEQVTRIEGFFSITKE